jgi:DNA replication and repair protein RecF
MKESNCSFLRYLYLRNFRNYKELELELSPGINHIFGQNALGKSNLLEAVSIISTGRSFRTSSLQDLVRFGENFFFLEACIEKDGLQHKIQISFENGNKKLNLDGNIFPSFQSLLGLFPSVFFTSSDVDLVDGPPISRRKLINLHLVQQDPLYFHHFSRYWRALKQRNVLLKSKDTSSIECWEIEMAESAKFLREKRTQFITNLSPHLALTSLDYSLGRESHSLIFHPSGSENYLSEFKKNREKEKILGTTIIGPHRDDFSFFINDQPAKGFSSEGQKRTSITSLRMAEWHLQSRFHNSLVVLGIDDFGQNLDNLRKQKISENLLSKGQVFITSTEPTLQNVHQIPITELLGSI